MKQQEIIKKLDENNNFHLTLKIVQFVDKKAINEYHNYLNNLHISNIIIDNISNSYELLKKAYDDKVNYVLCSEKINFVLPLISVITLDDVSIIKPIIPVYYLLKDNKIIQKVKTECHKKLVPFESFKTQAQLFDAITTYISRKN